MTAAGADPGLVLRRSLVAWGLGHLLLERRRAGTALLAAEAVSLLIVAWLTAGLADSTLYLVPFLGGVAFIVAWAWQAVSAYRLATRGETSADAANRSRAVAIAWLCIPLLAWCGGFWLVGARSATPAAVLDRFVADWSRGELDNWPASVATEAARAARALGSGPDRFRDVRIRVTSVDGSRATAVADAIHFDRRDTRLLAVFPGTELVPVIDRRVLVLELRAVPVELPGGGDIGAARWELVRTDVSG